MGYLPRKKKLERNRLVAQRLGMGLRTKADSQFNQQYESANRSAYATDVQRIRNQLKGRTGTYYLPPKGNAHSDAPGERSGYKDYLVSTHVRPILQSQAAAKRRVQKGTEDSVELLTRSINEKRAARETINPIRKMRLLRSAERNDRLAGKNALYALGDISSIEKNAALLKKAHQGKSAAIRAAKKPRLPQ